MKTVTLSLLLVFSFLDIYGQGHSETRYKTELQKAIILQDTIAAWITYKLTTNIDADKASSLLDQTLLDKYPIWTKVEKAEITESANYNVTLLEQFLVSSKNKQLQNYAKTLLCIKKAEEGIYEAVKLNETKSDNTQQKKLVFDTYLKALIYQATEEIDSLVKCMDTMTEPVNDSHYPALQLHIMSITLNLLNYNIGDRSHYIDQGINLSISLNEYKQRSTLYNSKVAYLNARNDIEGAMKAAIEGLEFSKLNGDKFDIVRSILNLAVFHAEYGRIREGYDLVSEAREIAISENDTSLLSDTYSMEASIKMIERKDREAIALSKKSLSLDPNKNPFNKAMDYESIIDCYYSTSELDSAYHYFELLERLDPDNKTGSLNYGKALIAKYLIDVGQMDRARSYISTAMDDAGENDDLTIKSIALSAQSELHFASGNYKEAYESIAQLRELESDFKNEKLASLTTTIQLESDFKNEKKIIELTNEKEKLEIESQRNQAFLLGGLALLSTISALGFYLFVRRKNTQINTQNQKLEELNNVKDTLFQIIGHDLKKPTINFRNVSKNINYLIEKEDFKRLKMLGEEVDQDAKSLYNLTDNLLNWALMQKDTISIKPERVNVHEIVNYNFDLFATLSKRKGIILENHVKKEVFSLVDRNSLDTIVRNLIDNAIKYTPEGGLISLSSKIVDGIVRLSVSDTGLGMDQNKIDAINNEQTIKSKKGTEGEKGSGLGLQLVKNLIKKNNGKFNIQSVIDSGSTIIVDFPLAS